jgi:hypothetical protein
MAPEKHTMVTVSPPPALEWHWTSDAALYIALEAERQAISQYDANLTLSSI